MWWRNNLQEKQKGNVTLEPDLAGPSQSLSPGGHSHQTQQSDDAGATNITYQMDSDGLPRDGDWSFTSTYYEKVMATLRSLHDTVVQSFKQEIEVGGNNDHFGIEYVPNKSQRIVQQFEGKVTTTKDSKNNKFGVYTSRGAVE